MKTIILLSLLTIFSMPSIAQESLTRDQLTELDAFDDYLDSLIDVLNYTKTHIPFRKLKKEAKALANGDKEVLGYVNYDAIERLLKKDPTLHTLGVSGSALDSLRLETTISGFNGKGKSMMEKRRMFKAMSNSKLYFSERVFDGMSLIKFYDASVDAETFASNIRNIKHFNTVHYLYECMKSWLELNELNKTTKNYKVMNEKMTVLKKRLSELTDEKYYKFDYTDISHKKVKDIAVHVQNDLFVPGMNRDMALTGGTQLEIGTDFLKMRLIPYINGDNILSYQTFSCGFYVYTPYIRDTDDSLKVLSYQHDRPFASTQYFGRTKYRLHRKGHIRHTGQFQLVILGGQVGPYVQKLLHKDVAVSSVKPIGWNNQIANGGRLGLKVYHKFDFMLASEHASIFNSNKYRKRGSQRSFFRYLNPFLSVDGQLSHEKTFLGASFTLSSRDFFNSSGNYTDFKLKKLQKIRLDYVINARYQYIFHNSLFEDFGLTHRYDDDPFDDEYLSVYYLQRDQMRRNVITVNFQINCRYRNATFFYHLALHTKEFTERELAPTITGEYREILEDRFDYDWYGWGTLGLVFNL